MRSGRCFCEGAKGAGTGLSAAPPGRIGRRAGRSVVRRGGRRGGPGSWAASPWLHPQTTREHEPGAAEEAGAAVHRPGGARRGRPLVRVGVCWGRGGWPAGGPPGKPLSVGLRRGGEGRGVDGWQQVPASAAGERELILN